MRGTRIIASSTVALLLVGSVRAQEDTAPAEPTPAEVRAALLDKLPPLVFGEDGVETLELEGVFEPILQRFELHARGGDSYDLLISGIDDRQPFLIGRDGTSLAYVPGMERGKVQIFPGLAQVHLALEGGQLRCSIAMVGPQEEDAGKRVVVTLDPASLLRGVTKDLKVERGEQGRYRLSGRTPRGSAMWIDVDPSARYPMTAMSVTPQGSDAPALEISKLVVNGKPGPRVVGIPSIEALGEHFDAEDLRERGDAEAISQGLGATFAATGARMRMRTAERSDDAVAQEVAAQDRRERTKLGELVRAAAASD
jgi:hypothetical protein